MTREQQHNHSDFKVIKHSIFDGLAAIESQEKRKAMLENKGYSLLSQNALQSVYGLPK